MVERLKFLEITQDSKPYWQIFNNDKQFLGSIIKKRVGAWMSWVFCPDIDDDMAVGDYWFSAGCMDEIREKMRELNGKK